MTDPDSAGAESRPVVAVVRRVLPAPPVVVYDEWLDAEALLEWMCPRPARCLHVVSEPWVGGALRIDVEDAGVAFFIAGRFTVLDRPHRLSFTWSCSTWPDPGGDSVVTVLLDAHGDNETLMTIEHTLLPPDLVEQHRRGWAAIAEQLEAELRRSPDNR